MMDGTTKSALGDLALLKPRQSLQNIGEKKKDGNAHGSLTFQAFGADGFTFRDFLDIVNPLQHIPIVSTLYRDMTGDQIDPGSRIAGGALFGGPIGGLFATANVALAENTGKDMGDYIVGFLSGGDTPEASPVALAQNQPGAPPDTTVGPATGVAPPLSPIAENIGVLQWARRETALMAEVQTRQTPDTMAAVDTQPVSAEIKKAADQNTAAKGKPYEIATNAEVLDWAKTEALYADNPALVQAGRQPERVGEQQRRAVAASLTNEQLAGATAPGGGWFSETMLLALASYQDSAGLGKPGPPSGGGGGNIGALDLNADE